MSAELDAAGITDASMRESYLECRRLNAEHGKTYFLATRLLPLAKRSYVHSLYGFARYADEIVDDLASTLTPDEKRTWLTSWSAGILDDIREGRSNDAIGMALIDTINRWQIPHHYFEAFLHSMAMDLTITEYASYEELSEYVYGSAAVIGLEMVHILGVTKPHLLEETLVGAKKLGIAFQLAKSSSRFQNRSCSAAVKSSSAVQKASSPIKMATLWSANCPLNVLAVRSNPPSIPKTCEFQS